MDKQAGCKNRSLPKDNGKKSSRRKYGDKRECNREYWQVLILKEKSTDSPQGSTEYTKRKCNPESIRNRHAKTGYIRKGQPYNQRIGSNAKRHDSMNFGPNIC